MLKKIFLISILSSSFLLANNININERLKELEKKEKELEKIEEEFNKRFLLEQIKEFKRNNERANNLISIYKSKGINTISKDINIKECLNYKKYGGLVFAINKENYYDFKIIYKDMKNDNVYYCFENNNKFKKL